MKRNKYILLVAVCIALLAVIAVVIHFNTTNKDMKATEVASGYYTYDADVTSGTVVVADYMHSIGIDGVVTECNADNDTRDIPDIVLDNGDSIYYVIMSNENCYVAVIRADGSIDYEQEY